MFTIATYNPRSLTFERFNYLTDQGIDVLVLTECWRTMDRFSDGTCKWTFSKPELDNKGKPKFPLDRAAGVGILLSSFQKCTN